MVERFEVVSVSVEEVLGRAEELGLVVREMGVLQGKGARHWHLTRAGERGVLELSELAGEVWLEVRSNRRGDWILGAVATLTKF
ncbi:hypothetical protein CCB80_02930 [Armatimonadetes bacterium Uphvl-Ar1]|nr:hypothetical protein CCB80_02930 [Armatimonadetes bacterium Uphvl-Ar1]